MRNCGLVPLMNNICLESLVNNPGLSEGDATVDRVQGRGFALVEVSNLSKAKRAKEVLDGPQFEGRP